MVIVVYSMEFLLKAALYAYRAAWSAPWLLVLLVLLIILPLPNYESTTRGMKTLIASSWLFDSMEPWCFGPEPLGESFGNQPGREGMKGFGLLSLMSLSEQRRFRMSGGWAGSVSDQSKPQKLSPPDSPVCWRFPADVRGGDRERQDWHR